MLNVKFPRNPLSLGIPPSATVPEPEEPLSDKINRINMNRGRNPAVAYTSNPELMQFTETLFYPDIAYHGWRKGIGLDYQPPELLTIASSGDYHCANNNNPKGCKH